MPCRTQDSSATARTSAPSAVIGCRGISVAVHTKKTWRKTSIDSAARPDSPGVSTIRARLIETATNTNPVSVAAAPPCKASSVCHSDSGGMERDLSIRHIRFRTATASLATRNFASEDTRCPNRPAADISEFPNPAALSVPLFHDQRTHQPKQPTEPRARASRPALPSPRPNLPPTTPMPSPQRTYQRVWSRHPLPKPSILLAAKKRPNISPASAPSSPSSTTTR